MSEQRSDTLARRPFTSGELLARLMPSDDVTLRFIHISDTHINPDPNYQIPQANYSPLDGTRRMIEMINALPFAVDFVLHTGDVVYEPDPGAYETAGAILSQIKYPVYYLPGNHDNGEMLQQVMLAKDEILAPFDYQFEVKGMQIVCVDSTGPAESPGGSVTEDQLARLQGIAKAKDDRPLVVAVHHNVLPNGVPWWDTYMRLTNGEDFHKALLPARDRIRGVFHGHVHQSVDIYRDGILYSSAVSSWYQIHCHPRQKDTLPDPHTPPGFSVVTVTQEQTFVRRYFFQI